MADSNAITPAHAADLLTRDAGDGEPCTRIIVLLNRALAFGEEEEDSNFAGDYMSMVAIAFHAIADGTASESDRDFAAGALAFLAAYSTSGVCLPAPPWDLRDGRGVVLSAVAA